MAPFTKSTRSVVLTLWLLLGIFVIAGAKKENCKKHAADYSVQTEGGKPIKSSISGKPIRDQFFTLLDPIKPFFEPFMGKKADNEDDETFAHPVTIIEKYGFDVECHSVKSYNDDYTTQLFRILPPKNSKKKSPMAEPTDGKGTTTRTSSTTNSTPTYPSAPDIKTKYPIFLGHGLLSSSVDWLLVKSEVATPFNLARAGYEVWLWNSRGSRYSMEFEKKDSAQNSFWDFSVHEMAVNDISAAIDYMLNVTKAKKINYIGYSMTTTAFHILMSERPKYNFNISKMVSLAPAVYLTRTTSPASKLSLASNDILLVAFQKLAKGRVYPESLNYFIHDVLPMFCKLGLKPEHLLHLGSIEPFICKNLVSLLAGHDAKALNETTMARQMSQMPADTSARTLLLYFQYFKDARFNQYDFGKDENRRRYKGSSTPPVYDLSKTKVDMMVSWGGEDALVNASDVRYYMDQLTNAKKIECFASKYSHLSFVYADCQREVVLDPILQFLQGKDVVCDK